LLYITTGFFFGWGIYLLQIIAALCLVIFSVGVVKKRLVLAAIPMAMPAVLMFFNFVTFYVSFSSNFPNMPFPFRFAWPAMNPTVEVIRLLIFIGTAVMFLLAALGKIKSKPIALTINLGLVGLFAFFSFLGRVEFPLFMSHMLFLDFPIFISQEGSVVLFLAHILFLASAAVMTYAVIGKNVKHSTASIICQKCHAPIWGSDDFCSPCGTLVRGELNFPAAQRQPVQPVMPQNTHHYSNMGVNEAAGNVAAVENNATKMPYDEALRGYRHLNEKKKADNKKSAIVCIICAVAVFGVCSLIQSFFNSSMFSWYYYLPYDSGFLSDFLLLIIALVAFWGGWIATLRLLFSFVVGIWQSREPISYDDASDLRKEAEKILQHNPNQAAEAEKLNKKADYICKVLSVIDENSGGTFR
jgi:hypothetical protein